ncbi:MAG: spore coat protein U domain-containing protein [Clostridia bacterium]|nr:spore coat protein U domain-containing protein [Deltaproteobacteria bacterium]
MKIFRSLLIAVAALGSAGKAYAGTATATMNVTARVTNSCTISAAALAFPDYDPAAALADTGTSTLSVTCTLGSTATISLDQGAQPASGSTAAAPLRQMASGTDRLGYSITQDAAHLVPWGGGLASESYFGLGVTTSVTVYGTIAAKQVVRAGNFADVVTATIAF